MSSGARPLSVRAVDRCESWCHLLPSRSVRRSPPRYGKDLPSVPVLSRTRRQDRAELKPADGGWGGSTEGSGSGSEELGGGTGPPLSPDRHPCRLGRRGSSFGGGRGSGGSTGKNHRHRGGAEGVDDEGVGLETGPGIVWRTVGGDSEGFGPRENGGG